MTKYVYHIILMEKKKEKEKEKQQQQQKFKRWNNRGMGVVVRTIVG
jgi:ribosomal protein S25